MHILSLLFILCFSFPTLAQLQHPEKIGIGTWESDNRGTSLKLIENMGFGWYYDWSTTRLWAPNTSAPRTVPFVPMIWDETHIRKSVPRASGVLLGFNEPDLASQAGMTVDQALLLWPRLMTTKLRLGSPATTTNRALGPRSWLGQFMTKAQAKGYRVDFISVHFYTTNKDVNAFKRYLINVHQAYGRPIWVTEWALVDWNQRGRFSYAETADYARKAILMMDTLPFVERHAWFAAHAYSGSIHTELFDTRYRLTPVGLVFREMLNSRP